MEYLANELLSLIITQGEIWSQMKNILVCSLWNQLIKQSLTTITSKRDIKTVCRKGDLLSIIMAKCHRYLKEIAKWSCVGGNLVIYNWLRGNGYDVSEAWYGCWWIGKLDLITCIMSKDKLYQAQCVAIKRGLPGLIPSHLSPAYVTWLRACMTGDLWTLRTLRYVQELYPNVELIDEGFVLGCSQGQTGIVRWLLENGTTVSEGSFLAACKKGRIEVVNTLISASVTSMLYFAKGVIAACQENRCEVITFLVSLSKLDISVYNRGITTACKYSNLEAAELMLGYGARNFRQALLESTDLDTIRWLLKKSAIISQPLSPKDLKPLLLKLCRQGQIQEIRALKSYLAPDLEDYLHVAKSAKRDFLVSYLSTLMNKI